MQQYCILYICYTTTAKELFQDSSFDLTILRPCFSNFSHNFPNMARKSDNDVGRNGIPCPNFAPFNTFAIFSISVPSKALSFSYCSRHDIRPSRTTIFQTTSSLSTASSILSSVKALVHSHIRQLEIYQLTTPNRLTHPKTHHWLCLGVPWANRTVLSYHAVSHDPLYF